MRLRDCFGLRPRNDKLDSRFRGNDSDEMACTINQVLDETGGGADLGMVIYA
jgi:hypothetical protein